MIYQLKKNDEAQIHRIKKSLLWGIRSSFLKEKKPIYMLLHSKILNSKLMIGWILKYLEVKCTDAYS